MTLHYYKSSRSTILNRVYETVWHFLGGNFPLLEDEVQYLSPLSNGVRPPHELDILFHKRRTESGKPGAEQKHQNSHLHHNSISALGIYSGKAPGVQWRKPTLHDIGPFLYPI